METFVAKVHYGSGPRLDPLMEERGGWISCEAQRQDVEIIDALIEVMAKANNYISREDLNSFKEQRGEILPSNLERNVSSFLIREDAIVNTPKLLARIPQPQAFPMWVALRELPFRREDAIVDTPKLPAPLLQPQAIWKEAPIKIMIKVRVEH